MDRFIYIGSTFYQAGNIDDEVDTRIVRASATFGKLRQIIWSRKVITVHKDEGPLSDHPSVTLVCMYSRDAKKLNHCHVGCFKKLRKMEW